MIWPINSKKQVLFLADCLAKVNIGACTIEDYVTRESSLCNTKALTQPDPSLACHTPWIEGCGAQGYNNSHTQGMGVRITNEH